MTTKISSPKLSSSSPRRKSSQIPTTKLDEHNRIIEETSKSSSQKPQLKITRNNTGTGVFVILGILFDLVEILGSVSWSYIFSTYWLILIIIQTCTVHSKRIVSLVPKNIPFSLHLSPLSVQSFQLYFHLRSFSSVA